MSCAVIEAFLTEVRARAVEKPAITPAHIATIETALLNAHKGAVQHPKSLGPMWGCIEMAITRTDWTVKAKLEEMGRIAGAFHTEFKKYTPPQSTSIM
jgi:hypothetical protein